MTDLLRALRQEGLGVWRHLVPFCLLFLVGCGGSVRTEGKDKALILRFDSEAIDVVTASNWADKLSSLYGIAIELQEYQDPCPGYVLERRSEKLECLARNSSRDFTLWIVPPLQDRNGKTWRISGRANVRCMSGFGYVSATRGDEDRALHGAAHELGHLLDLKHTDTGLMRLDPYNSEWFLSEESLNQLNKCKGN